MLQNQSLVVNICLVEFVNLNRLERKKCERCIVGCGSQEEGD